ncbi:3'-5' exonuclease [Vibrio nigripulchritudo]|uniref:3'-5' exonuclease n=1 Tax=Vibrio nigripulchritudo TaxID=28173 RepID=UPI0024908245|nr:3'-5' exonuclease [Vibrio nigripulchritudo]BDU37168.1 DNA polymerase III subunit epsilon [Vibrio nigripulchritudo]
MKTLNIENAVILDTETTGLGNDAQIVEFSAICAMTGKVLVNELVKPTVSIPSEATAIHGITDSDVAGAPDFHAVFSTYFLPLLNGRGIIIYNSDYDTRLIIQSLKLHCNDAYIQSVEEMFELVKVDCAMLWYAEFWGAINPYHGDYAWQKLTNACKQQNIDVSDLTAHRALADCEMTRRLIHSVNTQIEGASK